MKISIQTQVAFWSVLVTLYIITILSLIDNINSQPQTSNGIQIIHAGIEHKENRQK